VAEIVEDLQAALEQFEAIGKALEVSRDCGCRSAPSPAPDLASPNCHGL
jgi:hypothetical protein